jgi:hypothetical protein
VNPFFGFQVSVGIFSGRGKGNPFNARLIPRLIIDHLDFKPLPLHPPCVHPEKNFRPVLGFGAASSGIDGDNGVVPILGPVQHEFQGEGLYPLLHGLHLMGRFPGSLGVMLLLGDLIKEAAFLKITRKFLKSVYFAGELGSFLKQGLGGFGIVPEAFLGDGGFDLLEPFFFFG